MTAILDGIRRLEAAHMRGELSAVELAAAKADLMDSIPDVTPYEEASGPLAEMRHPNATPPEHKSGLGQVLLFCALILFLSAGLALLLTGDILLSATLAITVLAAFSVMLFRQLDI